MLTYQKSKRCFVRRLWDATVSVACLDIDYHHLLPLPYKIIDCNISSVVPFGGLFLVQGMDISWRNFGIQLDLNALMEVNLDTHGDPGSELLEKKSCENICKHRTPDMLDMPDMPDSGHEWLMNLDFWNASSCEKKENSMLAMLEAFAKYNPKCSWDRGDRNQFGAMDLQVKYYMYICGNLRASIALQLNPLEFLFRFAHSHWFSSAATRHRSTVESRHGCTSILNGLPRQCSATNPRLRGILSEICIGKEDRRRTVRLTETPPFPKAKNQLAGKKTTNTPPHILTIPHVNFLCVQCSIP